MINKKLSSPFEPDPDLVRDLARDLASLIESWGLGMIVSSDNYAQRSNKVMSTGLVVFERESESVELKQRAQS